MKREEQSAFIKAVNPVHPGAHVSKQGICDGKGCHGFYDNNGSWYNDRVVASVNGKL
jgi:hypothetical protein